MKRTILVIDDNTDIRENIAEILELAGYNVVVAENGKRGVELAIDSHPDLIICDIMMPELDGYGVLHLLRMKPETAGVPFIFLTAKIERGDWRKGMEMGADDYITKPFENIDLLRAVEARLKKLEIVQAKYETGEKGANEFIRELKVSGFLPLDPEQYDAVALQRKMLLYQEGKRPKFLYYVRSGKIKTYKLHPDGKEYVTNLYGKGDYIGHMALLENANYDDNAEVLEDAEITSIPREDFLQAIFNDLNIATKFIRLISKEVKEKEDRLLHLAYDSLRKRVAKALTDIHQKFSKEQAVADHIQIPREDIARYVGTATESLIRTLSEFKSEKLIEIRDGKIMVLEIEKLKNLLY
ncbi:response regulator [Pseudoflavitalea rhizosphaerae]|uniref:response regulator n=1 Tax=Pseudoflavitalea rhizosphaerae TaxID=1884793 RepID=UPI000F8CF84C|nr:response regulator [Pseudoflavitalea rhizosphaerae]